MSQWDFIYESPTFLDTNEFRRYANAVGTIVLSQPDDHLGDPGSITIRGIHETLGENAPRWTADALEWLSHKIETVGLLPTRYRRRRSVRPVRPPQPFQQDY